MGKRMSVFVLALLMALALLVSCQEPTPASGASLRIMLEDKAMGARTIMPAEALLESRKYSVYGEGPSGQSFGPLISSSSSVSVSDISAGQWTIEAKALNAENSELCSGAGVFNISSGQNNISLALNTIPGSGSLKLDLTWDMDISDQDSFRIEVSISDLRGNPVASASKTVDVDDCETTITVSLKAGSHVMSVRAFDSQGSLGVGATDAIRIVSNTRTSGTIHLNSPTRAAPASLSMRLENRTGLPMGFYLDYQPKDIVAGQLVTLRALHEILDERISASSLSYLWFMDGLLFDSGGSSMCSIQVPGGQHRYDVIVSSNLEGTMCGSSLLINAPQ